MPQATSGIRDAWDLDRQGRGVDVGVGGLTMVVFIYGTTGELVKLAPVMHRLRKHHLDYLAISTQQQPGQVTRMHTEFGFPPPDMFLSAGQRGTELARANQVPRWALDVGWNFVKGYAGLRARIRRHPGRHVVMVHGDTLTTVYGAIMGRFLGLPVAHLEAGMRSGDWRNPFPEELDRIVAGRIARVHYAPSEREVHNLSGYRGDVVHIGANTVIDSVDLVPDRIDTLEADLGRPVPRGEFAVASLHRTELLGHRDRFSEILGVLHTQAQKMPIIFIDHPVTAARIEQYRLGHIFDDERLVRVPRLGYLPFISLLRRSAFMVTDSGGAQPECFYLDHPCLVHRLKSEQDDGVGRNVVISHFDMDVVRGFLSAPGRWRVGVRPELPSPSDTVVADLLRRGVWGDDKVGRHRGAEP